MQCAHQVDQKPNVFTQKAQCTKCKLWGWVGQDGFNPVGESRGEVVPCDVPKGPVQEGHIQRDYNKPDRKVLVKPPGKA